MDISSSTVETKTLIAHNFDEAPPSLKYHYSPASIDNELRIIQDCIYLVTNSNNIGTVISRLELGKQKASLLQQLEDVGMYNEKPSAAEIVDIFLNNSEDIINGVLLKAYDNFIQGIDKLKTKKGKLIDIISFWRNFMNMMIIAENN